MKRMSLILLLVLAGAVVGCVAKFHVVNQDGLKAAYEDSLYAEARARYFQDKNPTSKDKDAAFEAYENARKKLNSYFESVKTQTSSTYEVNEPLGNYTKTSAPAELEKFHKVVAKYQAKGVEDLALGVVKGIGQLVIDFVEKTWKLKAEERKEALKKFETTITDNKMKPYAEIGSPSPPPKPGSTSGSTEPRK